MILATSMITVELVQVVNIKGIKTHETVENALKIVENLKHRAGKTLMVRPETV